MVSPRTHNTQKRIPFHFFGVSEIFSIGVLDISVTDGVARFSDELSIVLGFASIGVVSEVITGSVLGSLYDTILFATDSVESSGSTVVVDSIIEGDPIVSDRVGISVSEDETA